MNSLPEALFHIAYLRTHRGTASLLATGDSLRPAARACRSLRRASVFCVPASIPFLLRGLIGLMHSGTPPLSHPAHSACVLPQCFLPLSCSSLLYIYICLLTPFTLLSPGWVRRSAWSPARRFSDGVVSTYGGEYVQPDGRDSEGGATGQLVCMVTSPGAPPLLLLRLYAALDARSFMWTPSRGLFGET